MKQREIIVWLMVFLALTPIIAHGLSTSIPFYDSFIVRSGSMEPEISTGSLIYVKGSNPAAIDINDTITFETGNGFLTHKVIEKESRDGEYYFRTKGIANEEPDPGAVSQQDIVGEVVLTAPYLGYVLDRAGTFNGMVFLVIVPAAVILVYELRNILKELGYLEEETNLNGLTPSLIPSLILLLLSGILAWQIFLRDNEIPVDPTETIIVIIILLSLGIILLEFQDRSI